MSSFLDVSSNHTVQHTIRRNT